MFYRSQRPTASSSPPGSSSSPAWIFAFAGPARSLDADVRDLVRARIRLRCRRRRGRDRAGLPLSVQVTIGAGATVGSRVALHSDARVEPGAVVNDESLVMFRATVRKDGPLPAGHVQNRDGTVGAMSDAVERGVDLEKGGPPRVDFARAVKVIVVTSSLATGILVRPRQGDSIDSFNVDDRGSALAELVELLVARGQLPSLLFETRSTAKRAASSFFAIIMLMRSICIEAPRLSGSSRARPTEFRCGPDAPTTGLSRIG